VSNSIWRLPGYLSAILPLTFSSTRMNDNHIIELLRSSKSDKAFLSLYTHYPKVEKLVRDFGGTRDEAKDVYQEALVILYNKVNSTDFKLSAQLGTYLYSVCRFLWMDEMKKKKKRGEKKFDERFEVGFAEEMNEAVEKERKIRRVEEALALLGQKCKELLRLFYFNNKSMKEIAKQLGYASEDTAKTQKYKCIESAKKIIERE
jgi:RNA polymerase sigma factor (sigma-70 family)